MPAAEPVPVSHPTHPDAAAIILAGGRGTRMGSLTQHCPKPLLPVGGRPLVVHQFVRLAQAGIRQVVVSTGYRADAFLPTLRDGSAWGVQASYAQENTPLGTGGGLLRAWAQARGTSAWAGVRDVVVLNGDLLGEHDLEAQLEHHRSQRADVTIHTHEVDDVRAFGVVHTAAQPERPQQPGEVIVRFEEKPDRHEPGMVNAGTYVVRADVLDSLVAEAEGAGGIASCSVERDVFPRLIGQGARLLAHHDDTPFRDVGTPQALLAANLAHTQDVATLTAGAHLHPSADVVRSLVLPGAVVGAGAVVEDSLIGFDQVVPAGARVRSAVLS